MEQTIVGYHQDEEGWWVAELACGHGQHLRHDPPWYVRPWVLDEQERKARLGLTLLCLKCITPDEG